jgi:hypothetical protein
MRTRTSTALGERSTASVSAAGIWARTGDHAFNRVGRADLRERGAS